MFTRGRGGYPIEHMQTRGEEEGERGGGEFWAFCDNVIIECFIGDCNKCCEIMTVPLT